MRPESQSLATLVLWSGALCLAQKLLKLFQAPPLALVVDTRASRNLKIIHNKQNNELFAILLLFNNMSLSYPHPPCELFTPPTLTTQGFSLFTGY